MSLRACIPGMVDRGEITPEKGEEMRGLYDELHQDFRRQFGDQAADAMTTDATLKALETKLLRKKQIALGQVKAQQTMLANMRSFDGGVKDGAPLDPKAAIAILDRDERAGYSNVEGRRKAIRARAHAMIDGLLEAHHTNAIGQIRMKAQLGQIVKELFGEETGSVAARELADAWTGAAEMLRQRFNAAGGAIGKMERWGLPQMHDTRAVRAAGFEAWRDTIQPLLDRERMTDTRTGMTMSQEAMEGALRDVWETIRSDGWNKRTAGQAGRGALANQHSDSRFLQFKDADSWMAYQGKFGVGDAYGAMMGHIDGMSRDIALMEILGPNPSASFKWLKDTIQRSAATSIDASSKTVDRAHAGIKHMERLYDEITGAAGRPENRTLALTFSGLRSMETAAKLGGAVLSKPMELATQMVTRRFNGLAMSTTIPQYVKLMRPGADHALAVRLTGIADEWSQRAGSTMQTMGEQLTGQVPQRLAGSVLRLSGMSRLTEVGRWALGMEFMGHVTASADKAFGELDGPFQRALGRYGIGTDGWDAIRSTPLERDGGRGWIKPNNVADHDLGDKLYSMILSEVDYAVPTPDLRTKATINAAIPKGTWLGEAVRSGALFKSFGITMAMLHGRRIMSEAMAGRGAGAATYAAGLFIGTTLMGALSMQLKAVAAGQDARPMDDAGFWGAAVLQGGGFGIFGDFLKSTDSRLGGGFAGTLAGPLAEDAQNLVNAAKSKSPAWAAVHLARQEMPGGSLWYAKLAFDRLVTDQIQQAIDPNYAASWGRMENRANEQRTRYYWKPGETAPDHAPDFNNALGGDQ